MDNDKFQDAIPFEALAILLAIWGLNTVANSYFEHKKKLAGGIDVGLIIAHLMATLVFLFLFICVGIKLIKQLKEVTP